MSLELDSMIDRQYTDKLASRNPRLSRTDPLVSTTTSKLLLTLPTKMAFRIFRRSVLAVISIFVALMYMSGCSKIPSECKLIGQYYLNCNGLRVPMKKGWDAGSTTSGVWLRSVANPKIRISLSAKGTLPKTKNIAWTRIRSSMYYISESRKGENEVCGRINDDSGRYNVYARFPKSEINRIKEDLVYFVENTVTGDYQ